MTRVLVTGAGGRLGRLVVERLTRSGREVVGSVSATAGGELALDVTDATAVAALVEAVAPDVIVHLAGAVPREGAQPDFGVNPVSTAAVAAAASRYGVQRVILASSAAVYGDSRQHPVTEDAALDARSDYARSKVDSEGALLAAPESVALRIFNIHGPGFDDSLVSKLELSTPEAPARLRDLDSFVRDYVHASDVAEVIDLAIDARLSADHVVVNVGSGIPTSNRALVDFVSGSHDVHIVAAEGAPSYSVASTALLRRELGFVPASRVTIPSAT